MAYIGVSVVTVSWPLWLTLTNVVAAWKLILVKMLEENMHGCCLTEHPAFDIGCLNHWVLKLAGLSYKTRIKGCQNYTTLYKKGRTLWY